MQLSESKCASAASLAWACIWSIGQRSTQLWGVAAAAAADDDDDDDEWLIIAPCGSSPLPYIGMVRPENVKSSATMGRTSGWCDPKV